MDSTTPYTNALEDDTSRHTFSFQFWKKPLVLVALLGISTSVGSLAVHQLNQNRSRHGLRGSLDLRPALELNSGSNLDYKQVLPDANSSSNMSLNELNDLIRDEGVLIHSLSNMEYFGIFRKTNPEAYRKVDAIPDLRSDFQNQPFPNFAYSNLKSLTFAKGELPYAPNFDAFWRLTTNGYMPEIPNIAIIVDPNDEDVEIAAWRNRDAMAWPVPDVEQLGVELSTKDKCQAMIYTIGFNNEDSLDARLHVNRKIRDECKLTVKDEETFETFDPSKMDNKSWNERYHYKEYLSQNGTSNEGLNLVNFFPKITNLTEEEISNLKDVHTSSLWNEVVASFPSHSVKAIVYEDTAQGRKDAKYLQKLMPGHPPLFAFRTIGE